MTNQVPSSGCVGLITEYNPFHNGHLYHIEQAKKISGAKYVIVIMSGDFVQRGAPAIYDKYTRTRMALMSGADVVIEMPSMFATSSAEDFAGCGIALLDKLGCVSHVCFGSECGNIDFIQKIAGDMAEESEAFSLILKENLKKGLNFPQARKEAFLTAHVYSGNADYSSDFFHNGLNSLGNIFDSPNNILAIEYCKALRRRNSSMTPCTIMRAGSGYHDTALDSALASASALRTALFSGLQISERLREHVPHSLLPLMEQSPIMQPKDFSLLIHQKILSAVFHDEKLSQYQDISVEIASRIKKEYLNFNSLHEFITCIKPRQYTYTRISRALLHLLLENKTVDFNACKKNDFASYARILGFRRDHSEILSMIKKGSSIPLITKVADAPSLLSEHGKNIFRQDLYASHIYQLAVSQKYDMYLKNEYTQGVVIE